MRVLLDAGADRTARDDNGKMPSDYTKKGYPVAMALPQKRKESRETADVRHEIEPIITKHERKNLAQRLKQSMELLQLTLQQLEQRIDQELEQNPMLELELGVESSGETEERSHESDAVAAALVPDIVVEKDETGKYTVRLEDGRALQLRISKYYENLLEKQETDEETKAYIRKKVGAARWFLDAIEQRRGTLLKISQAMVDEQTEFFEKGQQALKPLSIQQIANITGMHATTVARACEEMWVSSPQGVFLLCRLFVGESATTDEETEPTE
jgi:DNA-directed RNA polymerase specialized sigma54-like protein